MEGPDEWSPPQNSDMEFETSQPFGNCDVFNLNEIVGLEDFLLDNDIGQMLFDDESYMNTDQGKLVPNHTSITADIKPAQLSHSPNPQLPVFKKEDTLSSFSYVSQEELSPKAAPMNHVYAPKVLPGGQIHSPNMYSLNQGQVTPLPPINFMNCTKMSPLTPLSSPSMSPALMHSPKMSPASHIGSVSPPSLHSPGSHLGSPCPVDAQAQSPKMHQNSHSFSPTVSTMNEVQSPKVSSVLNILPQKVSISGQVGIPQSYSTQSQPITPKPMQNNASPKNPAVGNINGYVVNNPTVMRQNNILLQGQVPNPTYVNFKSVTVPQQSKPVHQGDKPPRGTKAAHGAPPQHQLLVTDKGMSPLLVQGTGRRLAPVVLQAKHVKIEQQPRTLMYSTPVQGITTSQAGPQTSMPIHTLMNTSNGTTILTGIPLMMESDKVPICRMPGSGDGKPREVKRSAHNAIERRYPH